MSLAERGSKRIKHMSIPRNAFGDSCKNTNLYGEIPRKRYEGWQTVCNELVPWVRAGIDGPIPMDLLNAHQGVYVEKLYY